MRTRNSCRRISIRPAARYKQSFQRSLSLPLRRSRSKCGPRHRYRRSPPSSRRHPIGTPHRHFPSSRLRSPIVAPRRCRQCRRRRIRTGSSRRRSGTPLAGRCTPSYVRNSRPASSRSRSTRVRSRRSPPSCRTSRWSTPRRRPGRPTRPAARCTRSDGCSHEGPGRPSLRCCSTRGGRSTSSRCVHTLPTGRFHLAGPPPRPCRPSSSRRRTRSPTFPEGRRRRRHKLQSGTASPARRISTRRGGRCTRSF